MASESYVDNLTKPVSLDTSSWSKVDGLTIYHADYFPATKEVRIIGAYHSSIGLMNTNPMFTIPVGYRPSNNNELGFGINDFTYSQQDDSTGITSKLSNQYSCSIRHTSNGKVCPYYSIHTKSYRIIFDIRWSCQ